jgi:hypothetical protein
VLTVAIVAAAVLPHPPALLPRVTGRPIVEIEEIRAVAAGAVQWVFDAEPDVVVAVSGGEPIGDRTIDVASSAAGYVGTTGTGEVPLGLAVVAALLPADPSASINWQAVDHAASGEDAAALGAEIAGRASRVGLLVAGDGSARRGPKAPGYLDERAAPFDAEVGRALAVGDTAALRSLDPGLAAELLVAGRAAWQVLAGSVGDSRIDAHLDYTSDPFGVWCAVARWLVSPLVVS